MRAAVQSFDGGAGDATRAVPAVAAGGLGAASMRAAGATEAGGRPWPVVNFPRPSLRILGVGDLMMMSMTFPGLPPHGPAKGRSFRSQDGTLFLNCRLPPSLTIPLAEVVGILSISGSGGGRRLGSCIRRCRQTGDVAPFAHEHIDDLHDRGIQLPAGISGR